MKNKTHKNKSKSNNKHNNKRQNKTLKNRNTTKIKSKPQSQPQPQQFLYNPDNPSKSFDVYIDKNPKDTIPIKYTTVEDVENTVKKLEYLYKTNQYSHKRIWQVGMIMKVRLEAIYKKRTTKYKKSKNITQRYMLSKKYFNFLSQRTKMDEEKRKQFTFQF
jgi:hypothetical protein